MKKLLSVLIVAVLLVTQFVLPTFADDEPAPTIKNLISVTATKDLIAFYNSVKTAVDEDGVVKDVYVYDATEAGLQFEIEMTNGESFVGDLWETSGFFETEITCEPIMIYDENHIGTYETVVNCGEHTATVEVNIVETPVESIDVVPTFPLYENYSGYWEIVINENNEEEKYFAYNILDARPYFIINLKNGETIEGTAEEIYYLTGEVVDIETDQLTEHWTIGTNTVFAAFMGVYTYFDVEVVEDNIASITGEAMMYLIENHHGYSMDYVDEDGKVTEYFEYDVFEAKPFFTVTYKDGSTLTGTVEEIYQKTGVWVEHITEQGENPWNLGENTAKLSYLGHEFEMTIEIMESPVADVILTEENGLTIEIKYNDGSSDKAKAIDYVVLEDGYNFKEYIITDIGMIECVIYAEVEEEQEFYISVLGVKSNKLDNCDWLIATLSADVIAYQTIEEKESDFKLEVLNMNRVEGKWEKIYRAFDVETGESLRIKVVFKEDITVDKVIYTVSGDTNADGKVSAIDARQTLQGVAKLREFGETELLASDANGDGKITAIDARWILQAAAGSREI